MRALQSLVSASSPMIAPGDQRPFRGDPMMRALQSLVSASSPMIVPGGQRPFRGDPMGARQRLVPGAATLIAPGATVRFEAIP